MILNRKLSTRPLSLERLENRELMAGDVTAALVGGNLFITGGLLSNGVAITAGATPGTVQVEGLRQAGFGTKVNHHSGPQTFAVAHDIVVDLGNGDNLLTIQKVRLPGSLKISTGDGSDSLALADSTVARNLIVDTHKGNDTLTLSNDNILGRLQVNLGHGDDYFAMVGSHVNGNFDLDTGWNADRVLVRDSRVGGNMNIQGEADFAPKRVTLINVQVQAALSLQTGNGPDKVQLSHVSAAKIDLATAADNDQVSLDWVTANHLHVSLGRGKDSLTVNHSSPITG